MSELRRAMDGVKDTVNPSKVLDKMMEEEEKKEKAKKTAKKEAPKSDAAADKTGTDAETRTETTKKNQDTKDTASGTEAKKTPGGDTELKG